MDPENEKAWYWAGEAGTSQFAPIEIRQKSRRRARQHDATPQEDLPHQIVLRGTPIQLAPIEHRIVTFLASRPYHAFTPEEIVAHVNEQQPTIGLSALREHVISLRSKLGFFRDYVQSVPYIGYRFKP